MARVPGSFCLAVALVLAASGCESNASDRVLAIEATGVVRGLVYFDRNDSRTPDAGDTTLSSIAVHLLVRGTRTVVARVVSDAAGNFRAPGLPVGGYTVAVDSTRIPGDSIVVTRIDTSLVDVRPGDSVAVRIALGFPRVTVAQARALPVGRKIFVVAVALNNRSAFGDTTVHFADTSGAIRGTAVRSGIIFAGDSGRVLGTRRLRDGQPTLDQATMIVVTFGATQPTRSLTTVVAARADSGRADAALVRIAAATVIDTATVGANRRLTVDDGSGRLEMRLDSAAGFTGPALAADTIGARLDATGLLVPTGTGQWRLKPRSPADIVHK